MSAIAVERPRARADAARRVIGRATLFVLVLAALWGLWEGYRWLWIRQASRRGCRLGDQRVSRRGWKVDPRIGRVSAVIPLYHGPVDIAIGERAVWTVNDDGTVSRIDPKTATLARTIPLGRYPRIAYPV